MFDAATDTSQSAASSGTPYAFERTASSRESSSRLAFLDPKSPGHPFAMTLSDVEFKALYQTHFRLVWCGLTRWGAREVDVMDLAQKVFLIAYLKLPDFQGRSQLSTWLWGICRRVAVAHRRSGAMRHEVATDPAEFETSLEPRVRCDSEPDSTRQVAVEQLLGKLSESQRVVFTLSEVDDLDGVQIATLLNISLGTVRSRLRYARQRIRREVKRLTIANTFERTKPRG